MKKIIFRIIAVIIGISLAIASFELFFKLNPKIAYNYNSFVFKQGGTGLDDFSYMRPSALLGYEHIPGVRQGINSFGMVGKEHKFKKGSGTFRILILGDSIAEQGYTYFLEDYLNSDQKLNSKFEIWNAGVASYDVRRYFLYLKHKGLNFRPDMIIIYLCLNDFNLNMNIYYKDKSGATAYYFPVSEIKRIYAPSPFLMKHSYLYRFVILNLNNYLASRKEHKNISPEEESARLYLGLIKEICLKNNISLSVVIFPYLKPINEYGEVYLEEYKTACKVMEELKIPNLNLSSLYINLINEDFPIRESPGDDIHPSEDAHRLICKEIYKFILNNSLIKD